MRHEDSLLLQDLDRLPIIIGTEHGALMIGLGDEMPVSMETLEERDSHVACHSIRN